MYFPWFLVAKYVSQGFNKVAKPPWIGCPPSNAPSKSLWRQELLAGHTDSASSVTVHRVSEESCRVIVMLGM